MTDRELLEAAARAAGKDLSGHVYLKETGSFYWDESSSDEWTFPYEEWNPLADDGAALRLAVKLRIDICISPNLDTACAWCDAISDFMEEPLAQGEMLAMRRAIVRAAAAMAGAKP